MLAPQLLDHSRLLFSMGATEVSVSQAVQVFLRFESVHWSEATGKWYAARLLALAGCLGPDRALGDLQEVDLLEWYAGLRERDTLYPGDSTRPEIGGALSPYTLHGHARAARRFFKWLFEKGVLAADLGAGLDLPRLPKGLKKGISDADALAILDAAKASPRDYALISFIESTGVRRGGVEGLLLSDLALASPVEKLRRRATVREKGEKERTVIMSAGALSALVCWLAVRPGVESDHVFVGHSPGQPWRPLKDESISKIFERYRRALGLTGPCSPHQWRHRWCRNRLEAGMPLNLVADLAGHADIKTTKDFYGGFSVDDLQNAYDRYYEPPRGGE